MHFQPQVTLHLFYLVPIFTHFEVNKKNAKLHVDEL